MIEADPDTESFLRTYGAGGWTIEDGQKFVDALPESLTGIYFWAEASERTET